MVSHFQERVLLNQFFILLPFSVAQVRTSRSLLTQGVSHWH